MKQCDSGGPESKSQTLPYKLVLEENTKDVERVKTGRL